MTARIIDGKQVAQDIRAELKEEAAKLKEKGIVPGLGVILVGEDPASKSYVTAKERACEEIGLYSDDNRLPAETSQEKLMALVKKMNDDPKIHGILVQLPLPKHIDRNKIIEAIDPKKDADCLHPLNFGRFAQEGEEYSIVAPATPLGIIKLLEEYKIKIEGKNAVVVGRSNIVGKPMAQFLLNRDATVTICHRHTKNLKSYTQKADILVVAVGKMNMIKANMVKKGAVVIDVGVNRGENKKIFGDIDFKSVSKKASHITPVPGGVGPMTIAMLLWNTVRLTEK